MATALEQLQTDRRVLSHKEAYIEPDSSFIIRRENILIRPINGGTAWTAGQSIEFNLPAQWTDGNDLFFQYNLSASKA
eukprot:Pgem_evm3s14807